MTLWEKFGSYKILQETGTSLSSWVANCVIAEDSH